jgi:hypothetical protein
MHTFPAPADGEADIAVFRLSNGVWYIRQSSTLTAAAFHWGGGSDIPLPHHP